MNTESGCCDALGGQGIVDTQYGKICEKAPLIGRPYDIYDPCSYFEAYESARNNFEFGSIAFDIGYFLGSTSAFLIPSTSAYTSSDPENPPLAENYEKTVKDTANMGLKIFGIIAVVIGFLAYKYLKK